MLVNDKHLTTIWYEKKTDKVKIIDQRLIPFELKIIELNTVDEVCFAIKEMQVRGAPLIGVTAAYGMYIASKENSKFDFLQEVSKRINSTRPTAVNLSWALSKVMTKIADLKEDQTSAKILEIANQIRQDDIDNCKTIGEYGYELIKKIYALKNKPVNILTHCNAGWLATVDWGTALAPVFVANKNNIPIHVWVDETRPRNQGAALTAWELKAHGVPHTVIVDNAGGHLMQQGQVDLCIVGSDRTTRAGDVCNKIGTYLKALAARDNDVPFYVAVPSSTIDWNISDGRKEIPIEERNKDEVLYVHGIGLDNVPTQVRVTTTSDALNPAFDITPKHLVTGLITERGICAADELELLKLFPENRTPT